MNGFVQAKPVLYHRARAPALYFILKDKKTKVYQELEMDLKSYGYPLNSQGIPTRECTWLPPLNEPTVTHQYHCLA